MLNRLFSRISLKYKAPLFILSVVVPLFLILAISLLILWQRTYNVFEQRLLESKHLVERCIALFQQNTLAYSKIIADDYHFRQGIHLNDIGKIRPGIKHFIDDLGINHIEVYNADAYLLLRNTAKLHGQNRFSESMVARALSGEVVQTVAAVDGRVLLECYRPVYHSNVDRLIVGAICVGYLFDHELAGRIKQISGVDLVLMDRRKILASSFPGGSLEAGLKNGPGSGEQVGISVDGRLYDSVLVDFQVADADSPKLLAALDQSSLKQALSRSTVAILLSFLVIGSLGVAFSLAIASSVARTVGKIMAHVRRLEHGSLEQPLQLDSRDEFADVAETLNAMSRNLNSSFQKIENQAKELAVTKSFLDNIINSMPSMLISADTRGQVTMLNRLAAAHFQDLTAESQRLELKDYLAAYDSKVRTAILEAVAAGRQLQLESLHYDHQGRSLIHDLKVFPLTPKTTGRVMIRIDDVTETYLLESQLRHSQKMEAIGTLAGGIAHDFNNILAAVLGFVDLAMIKRAAGGDIRNELEGIKASALRARDLTSQILTFSRKDNSHTVTLNLSDTVHEALGLVRATLPNSIRISENLRSTAQVRGNPTEIYQIVMNLCSNAAQAMVDQSGSILVETMDCIDSVRPGAPSCETVLRIKDDGCGIPLEDRDKIFDPFFTTRQVGSGTGLGLSTVHTIVRNYGGSIRLESEPGKGTTFLIILPCVMIEEEPRSEKDQTLVGGGEHICVIDDERMVLETEEQLLLTLGYRVSSFSSAEEALDSITSRPESYDLILSDLTMPGLSGDQLAAELRTRGIEVPVIITTGYQDWLSQERRKASGISLIIRKPMTLKDLAGAVRSELDRRGRLGSR